MSVGFKLSAEPFCFRDDVFEESAPFHAHELHRAARHVDIRLHKEGASDADALR